MPAPVVHDPATVFPPFQQSKPPPRTLIRPAACAPVEAGGSACGSSGIAKWVGVEVRGPACADAGGVAQPCTEPVPPRMRAHRRYEAARNSGSACASRSCSPWSTRSSSAGRGAATDPLAVAIRPAGYTTGEGQWGVGALDRPWCACKSALLVYVILGLTPALFACPRPMRLAVVPPRHHQTKASRLTLRRHGALALTRS
jgi:hypothetical protein